MSIRDSVTGDVIYNPYLRIYGTNGKFVEMNSTTFGEAQEYVNLITFKNRDLMEFEPCQDISKSSYLLKAVVSYQSPLGHQRPQYSGPVISETFLGTIKKEDFKVLFPKSYAYLETRLSDSETYLNKQKQEIS